MTPVVNQFTMPGSGLFTITSSDTGTNFKMLGDTSIPDFDFDLNVTDSRTLADSLHSAENTRDLETKRKHQACFEQEMGAKLLSYNSQALVKTTNFDYVQTSTQLAFESYVAGLDGCP